MKRTYILYSLMWTILVMGGCSDPPVTAVPTPESTPAGTPSAGDDDLDDDGFAASSVDRPDCDDFNNTIFPGAPERCDGLDNDCDGDSDEDSVLWYPDADGDGYGVVEAALRACVSPGSHFVTVGGDCDDNNVDANPGALEICDGGDNNCDGEVDETGVTTFYFDGDRDGFGRSDTPMTGCVAPGQSWVVVDGDCDDGRAESFPHAPELCDGLDNSCDGLVDEGVETYAWYPDSDGDGYGDLNAIPVSSCAAVDCAVLDASDCDDSDRGVSEGGVETCDGRDEDCNGLVDDGALDQVLVYIDADGDGVGAGAGVPTCEMGPNQSAVGGDCDDAAHTSTPGRMEVCDGLDNNCDGKVDEDFDVDKDGFTACGGDPDDGNSSVFPYAPEGCDGVDNDGDGDVDEGFDQDRDGYAPCGPRPDCNDKDVNRSPGVAEALDGIDNNCSGVIDEGYYIDLLPGNTVNVIATGGGFQLNEKTEPFEFMWAALSSKGTVVKVHTDTGEVLGEFRTHPDNTGANPSRTTVDKNGNVWITNRAESGLVDLDGDGTYEPRGSVVRIGLLENGGCEDRDGDGVIRTSQGLGDVLPWFNEGGVDTAGGVNTAEDECIINYVRVHGVNARHVSITEDNNAWIGGYDGSRDFDLLDGDTGEIITSYVGVGLGGYGGTNAAGGLVWSSGRDKGMFRWDSNVPLDHCTPTVWPEVSACTSYTFKTYGLGIADDGTIWTTSFEDKGEIHRISKDGVTVDAFNQGCMKGRGVVVGLDGDTWYSCSDIGKVMRMRSNGVLVGGISVGQENTGVAVDSRGKIWVTNQWSRTLMRIDPLRGQAGEVDFTTADLGGEPENYSDMTGSTLLGSPLQGTFSVVYDGGIKGAQWGTLDWLTSNDGQFSNGDNFDGEIRVQVMASDDLSILPTAEHIQVEPGEEFVGARGRYLAVSVTFIRGENGANPFLRSLTVWPWIDQDQDGFSAPADCDDLSDLRYPEAPESCNGIDMNCDGAPGTCVTPN